MSPQHFAEHLDLLQRHFTVMPLADMVEGHRLKRLPRDAVALTFDDGYSDNLAHALPVLEKFGIPATLFLTTGSLDKVQEFWWDLIERIIFGVADLEAVEIPIGEELIEIDVEAATSDRLSNGWHAMSRPTTRAEASFINLWTELRSATNPECERVMGALCRLVFGGHPQPREGFRPLSRSEVRTLVGSGLVSLGAHTVNHADTPDALAPRAVGRD